MAKNDKSAEGAGKAQAGSAPELDADKLDDHRRREIESAFTVDRDTDAKADAKVDAKVDVEAELDDDSQADETTGITEDDKPPVVADTKPDPVEAGAPSRNPLARLFRGYGRHKKWTIPLTILLLAGAIMAVPATRYPVLATFLKREVVVAVIDDGTKKPVSSAIVELDGSKATTDNDGLAKFKARVGDRSVTVTKRYYQDAQGTVFVPVGKMDNPAQITVKATGRQVPIAVVNKLSGKPVENAVVKAADTEIKTDAEGKATLVLPADKPTQQVEIGGDNFNDLKATLVVSESVVPQNTFQIVPSGKVYFLSKQSGKIDVVKTDLDGSDRKTVVAGTGKEEENNTILLASRDWKYLAMLSRRDSAKPKLYLISTADDKMSVMDEGDASFQLIGWSDSTFTYSVTRNAVKETQNGKYALKSYDAASAKLATLDQTQAESSEGGHVAQSFGNYYLVGNQVVYTLHWSSFGSYYSAPTLAGKQLVVRTVGVNGQGKKDLKGFWADKFWFQGARLYAPGEVYFSVYDRDQQKPAFYEYEDGTVKPANVDADDFHNKAYPTFLESPSKKRTFWSESRDGKDTFFTGNPSGEEPKQVAVLPEHQVYGWYSDDYLLASKKGSELFIMPADGSKQTKVTDYHKPTVSFRGYGGGYGGL